MSEHKNQGRRYLLAANPEQHGQGIVAVDVSPGGLERRQPVLFLHDGDGPMANAMAVCEALATAYREGYAAASCPVRADSTEAGTAAGRYQLRAQQAAHDAAYAIAEGRTSEASHLLTAATCYISAWRAAQREPGAS